ncbi:MAG TPA: cyanophycin synthetase, partial [Geminicoccaceae bacterium]
DHLEVWLDGGHNPAAGRVLAESLADDPRDLHLVVGMLRTKDAQGFIAPLGRIASSLTAVPVPDEPASRPAAEIAREARRLGLNASVAPDVGAALRAIGARAAPGARVLICGSLYLAGAVLRENVV